MSDYVPPRPSPSYRASTRRTIMLPDGTTVDFNDPRVQQMLRDAVAKESEGSLLGPLPPERPAGLWGPGEGDSTYDPYKAARGAERARRQGAARALQTIPTGPITGVLSGLTEGRSQEALTATALSNPEAPNMAAAIEGLGLVDAPGLGSKALVAEIAGNARTQTGTRRPGSSYPLDLSLIPPMPRQQITEGSDIPADIRNLDRPATREDIERAMGGLPPVGPDNLPKMENLPISAKEVAEVLGRWKEFAPEQQPNEAAVGMGVTPENPDMQFNAATDLIREGRGMAANLTGEPSVRGTKSLLTESMTPIAANYGDAIGVNPKGFASTYIHGQPETGAAALRARLAEIIPHEFGHGGPQGPEGTAALHQFETVSYPERPGDLEGVTRPPTLKIGEQSGQGRLPGEADMTVDLSPLEYAGLPSSTRRRFSLGDEVEAVQQPDMVRGELLSDADARAASGSPSEHLFQTRSEAVRNSPEFQKLIDEVVAKYTRGGKIPRKLSDVTGASTLESPETLSDLVYPYANPAESAITPARSEPTSVLDTWMATAARKGLTEEQALKGAEIIMDGNEDYYAKTGFNGLIEAITPKQGLTYREAARRQTDANRKKF